MKIKSKVAWDGEIITQAEAKRRLAKAEGRRFSEFLGDTLYRVTTNQDAIDKILARIAEAKELTASFDAEYKRRLAARVKAGKDLAAAKKKKAKV